MSQPPGPYRCPLGRLLPRHPDADAIKREGWRDQRILVVALDDERLDWIERQLVQQIGERLYGPEGKRHVDR